MSTRNLVVAAVIAAVSLLTVVSSASLASADSGGLAGDLPADGGLALVSWAGGSPAALSDDAVAGGCRSQSVWASDGGQFHGFLFGAPDFVNAGFRSRFPGDQIPARPLLLLCERRGDAAARLGALAAEVSDAIRDRDQVRLRDLSGDQLQARTRDQDRDQLIACWPDGAGFQLLAAETTVEGATALVEARFRIDQPGGAQFELARTSSYRWMLEDGWRLDELPLCPYASSANATAIENAVAAAVRAIRDRDQLRLRDLADDPDRDQLRTQQQRRDRLHAVDGLVACVPLGGSLDLLGMSATTAQNTAVVTARLRLHQGGVSSEQVVTWQFRRTMQNQWRLDDTVPACPFGPQTVTTLSAADGGSTVTLSTGDRLYVELEGNPTTGFTWELDSLPSILEQLGDATFVPESELIGGGGEFTLRFEAVATGSGVLRLTYLRPFEDVPAADTFEVTVVVQ